MSGQGLAGGTPGSRIFVTYFRELDLGPWAACPQPPTDRLWGGGLAARPQLCEVALTCRTSGQPRSSQSSLLAVGWPGCPSAGGPGSPTLSQGFVFVSLSYHLPL